jgi:hypothetical protein
MRFRLIEDHRGDWPARVMRDALSVSPSGFCAWVGFAVERRSPYTSRSRAKRAFFRM